MGKLSIVVCLFCLLVAAVPQGALAKGHGPDFGGGVKAYKMLFSEEQNKQLDVLVDNFRKDIAPFRKAMIQQHQELRAMMKDASVSESALKAQVMKGAETVSRMVVKRAEMLRAVRKIATPEQLAKVDAFEAKERQDRAKWMQRWEKMQNEG
ncbi:hypothetical protein JCM15519_30250 [Fundidesulfovibrio butyratiphilus]